MGHGREIGRVGNQLVTGGCGLCITGFRRLSHFSDRLSHLLEQVPRKSWSSIRDQKGKRDFVHKGRTSPGSDVQGESLEKAAQRPDSACEKIVFPQRHFRTDIGWRALKASRPGEYKAKALSQQAGKDFSGFIVSRGKSLRCRQKEHWLLQ